jgi:electron transfer flavoprotein beta subunit
MNIVVPMKFVPDLVEELEIDSGSGLLDRTFLRLIPNELDEHALEEALLLKERGSGTVTVITLSFGDVDEALFTAVAKGADRVIKIQGDDFDQGLSNHAITAILENALKDIPYDVILTGTQAVDDLDGFVGPLLAARLGLPYVGYVTKVACDNGKLTVGKEYPGGLTADIEIAAPAVIGIQAAEKPPRYVVTSLVMQAMKTANIEEQDAAGVDSDGAAEVSGMAKPESGTHAEMLDGTADQVAEALVKVLREQGLAS